MRKLLTALTRRLSQRPFALTRDPLLRVGLLRLTSDTHILTVTLHHLASDGWSVGVLVEEFATRYAAAVTGEALTLAPLPVQYGDYAAWQRGWWQETVLAPTLA